MLELSFEGRAVSALNQGVGSPAPQLYFMLSEWRLRVGFIPLLVTRT